MTGTQHSRVLSNTRLYLLGYDCVRFTRMPRSDLL